jgi:hypothetical protein
LSDITKLINILNIPSFTGEEDDMVAFICDELNKQGVLYTIDEYNNIFAYKGTSEVYPCICCHTDTVFDFYNYKVISEFKDEKTKISGLDPSGNSSGIGADDKTGIYICLELLKQLPVLKVAFFAMEEIECLGASLCNMDFFNNVGYCLEFDCPGINSISYKLSGQKLFEIDNDFSKIVLPILKEHNVDQFLNHPYTDIKIISEKTNLACINLPAGYYKQHTKNEYTIFEDVLKAIQIGLEIVIKLGNNRYLKS